MFKRPYILSLLGMAILANSAFGMDLNDGLVGYWSFDDGTATDHSGNGNDGAIHGAVPVAGVSGQALSFDGVDDYVNCLHSTDLNMTGAITIVAWINVFSITWKNGDIVVAKRADLVGSNYEIRLVNGDSGYRFAFDFSNPNPDYWYSQRSIRVLDYSMWHHLATTFDMGAVVLFVNGNLDIAHDGFPQLLTNNAPFNMANYGNGQNPDGLHGLLDEVRIYNRALSETEIQFLYQYPDGDVLVIDDSRQLWGNINQYDAIYVIDGGSITVPEATWNNNTWEGGYLMLEADYIYVDASSSIHADSCGFSKEDGHSGGGPGKGMDYVHDNFTALQSADGAGYGGRGGHYLTTIGPGGSPYGSYSADDTNADTLFGSSGGDYAWLELGPDGVRRGGRGGGYIRLRGNTVIVEGTITANGGDGLLTGLQPPGAGSGGGSGGQIVLDSPNLTVTGTVQANGGDGSDPSKLYSSGGGAGGRIKVLQSSSGTCGGTFSVSGGGGCGGMGRGEPGKPYYAGQPASPEPNTIDLHPEDDTGRDDDDYLTNLSAPRIVGEGPANALIRVYEGGAVVGSAQSDGSGSFAVPAVLSDGPHTLTATAQENCHDESTQSAVSVTLTVDTQKPTTPIIPDMIEDLFHGGQSLTDNITSDASPTCQGLVDPNNEWILYVDSIEEKRRISADGTWYWTINPKPEGNHQITVKSVDEAGNESDLSPALSVLLDLTDPNVSNMQINPTDCQLDGTIFTIQASVTDALSGVWTSKGVDCDIRFAGQSRIASVELDHQGGSLFSGTWDSTGAAAGTYTIDFEAADIAGNESEVTAGATLCVQAPTPYCGDQDHPYPDGDINKNCYVNFVDFSLLENRWLDTPCSAGNGWCDGLDLSENGSVDLEDIAILANRWLDCTDPLPPCEYIP